MLGIQGLYKSLDLVAAYTHLEAQRSHWTCDIGVIQLSLGISNQAGYGSGLYRVSLDERFCGPSFWVATYTHLEAHMTGWRAHLFLWRLTLSFSKQTQIWEKG